MLNEDDSLLVDAMLGQIKALSRKNMLRTAYVEGEYVLANLGVTIPPPMQDMWTVVGWPKKAVDVMVSRLRPESFRLPRDSDVFDVVSDTLSDSDFAAVETLAIESAARHGCSFVTVSAGEDHEEPVVYTMRSAEQATVWLDQRTRRPVAGLEFIEQDVYAFYARDYRYLLLRTIGGWEVVDRTRQLPGRLGITAYTFDSSASHPLGQSRVTNPVMGFTDAAVRTVLRQEVSAEFFSSPQRYMLGADMDMFTDEQGNLVPAWRTIIGSMLVAPTHFDPDTLKSETPQVGQFTQQSMQPHSDHLRSLAMMFSGETSIPVSYLGVLHDNPASADAIIATESDLITKAEGYFPEIARARRQVFLDTAAVLWPGVDHGDELRGLSTRFRNAATPNLQSQAQSVTTLVGAGVLPAQARVTWEQMGFDEDTILALEAYSRRSGNQALIETLQSSASPVGEDAEEQKKKFDALGVAIRAGVDPAWAASRLGLGDAQFTGAVPVSLRLPEVEASKLEET